MGPVGLSFKTGPRAIPWGMKTLRPIGNNYLWPHGSNPDALKTGGRTSAANISRRDSRRENGEMERESALTFATVSPTPQALSVPRLGAAKACVQFKRHSQGHGQIENHGQIEVHEHSYCQTKARAKSINTTNASKNGKARSQRGKSMPRCRPRPRPMPLDGKTMPKAKAKAKGKAQVKPIPGSVKMNNQI